MLLKNCYVEVNASFQLEKDNAQKNATAFAKVLSMYLNEDVYQYNDREDELTEKLLCYLRMSTSICHKLENW